LARAICQPSRPAWSARSMRRSPRSGSGSPSARAPRRWPAGWLCSRRWGCTWRWGQAGQARSGRAILC